MKKINYVISLVIIFIIIFFVLLFITNKANKPVQTLPKNKSISVILDAGHGGEDGGAVANDGSLEKDINLEIVKKLQNILNLYGVEVIMTRTSDISIYDDGITSIKKKKISDIHNRFKIIEENPNSLFVSIHQNKFQSEKQFGTQVFYSKNTASSKRLAQCIQESVVGSLQPENKRVVKPTGTEIYLLYHAHSTAVLVECGFVSNDEELSKLKDNDYQTAMAVSIANGIIKYSNDG